MPQPDCQEKRKATNNQRARKRYLSDAVRVGCAVLGIVSASVVVPVGSANATDVWPPACSDLSEFILERIWGEGAAVTSSSN